MTIMTCDYNYVRRALKPRNVAKCKRSRIVPAAPEAAAALLSSAQFGSASAANAAAAG